MDGERLWSKDFVVLMIIQMCDFLTYYMVTPVVAQYATLQGASIVDAGILAGVAMSTFLLGTDIGYGLGPVLGGAVAASAGYEAMFLVSVPIMAVALLTYVWWSRSLARDARNHPAS